MKTKLLWPIGLTAALTLASALPALAADDAACSAPGVTVLVDPAGDEGLTPDSGLAAQPVYPTVPLPEPDADILKISAAEVGNQLVWTYKVSDLSSVLQEAAWIIRFSTDESPANGDDDFFVAMVTDSNGAAQFVYGSTGFQYGLPTAEPRQFHIMGQLPPPSGMNADGTITLALDEAAVPGISAGTLIYNVIGSVRLITPTDSPAGFFTNADNSTIIDQAVATEDTEGTYQVSGSCGGKSGLLGLGAASPLMLAMLGLFGLAGRISKRRVK